MSGEAKVVSLPRCCSTPTKLIEFFFSHQTYNPAKPKSWDNLTSKAYGGYGFGYGYLDAAAGGKTPPPAPSKTTTMPHFSKVKKLLGVVVVEYNHYVESYHIMLLEFSLLIRANYEMPLEAVAVRNPPTLILYFQDRSKPSVPVNRSILVGH